MKEKTNLQMMKNVKAILILDKNDKNEIKAGRSNELDPDTTTTGVKVPPPKTS